MALFYPGLIPATDTNDDPIVGATWNFYLEGTLTSVAVYSDDALSVSVGPTVTSGAGGRFANIYWNDAISTRAILKDDGGATLRDIDPLDSLIIGGGALVAASTTEQLTGTSTTRASTPDSVAALWEQGADVASASTISLGEGGYFSITGTTTITDIDFATDKAGRKAWLKFAGALTLTHNATTLILPAGANITTAAGDIACFISEGSDVVRCVAYTRANGTALVGAVSDGDKGDIAVSASGATWTIDNDAVTYAKMQNISATSRILGRKTAGSGDTEECTLSEVLDFIGSAAQGDILYRGASGWARLAAGTSGHYLKTLGAGADPAWASVSGSGNAWNLQWSPMDNEQPATNGATLDTRNGHPVLDFDTGTQETAIFSGVLPADYSGAGVTIYLWVAATSATTGTIGWDVAFERIDASSLDIDADSFGSATTVTATTVPGTSGQVLKMSVNVSNGANMDSLAAGEMFRLRIRRDVANDNAAGDAELLRVMMVSQ